MRCQNVLPQWKLDAGERDAVVRIDEAHGVFVERFARVNHEQVRTESFVRGARSTAAHAYEE
jgi:hypothetical protein